MRTNGQLCCVAKCGKPSVALGLCWKHYMRQHRHGDVHRTERRYAKPHKCRFCGTTNPEDFYAAYKSVCRTCRKLKIIQAEVQQA